MEKRATETQPRAGGGRREAGDEREQPRKTEKTEKGGRRDATSSTDGGGGGCSGGLQREQTNGPLLLQQKIKEARIRAEDGLQEMKTGWCRPRWAFWRHPFIGGEQMPAPGGPPSTPQALKRGHGHLHLEAGEARHFASLSHPPTASSTTMKRVSGFLFCRANLTTHFSMPFSTPIFHPSSRPSRPLPHPCHNHHRRWPLDLAALQIFRNPRG